MKKREYSFEQVEDFFEDDRFISWVKNPTPELDQFWSNWRAQFPEKIKLLEQACLLANSIHFHSIPPSAERFARVFDKIEKGDYSPRYKQPKFRVIPSPRYWTRIAAILLLFFSVGSLVWYFSLKVNDSLIQPQAEMLTVSTKYGEKQTVILPDGSEVIMNSGSTLSYLSHFHAEREVLLVGEAFFDVTRIPEKPFVVRSGGIATRVLGTSFNVKAYEDEDIVAVALKSGKVEIRNEASGAWSAVTLIPGEKLMAKSDNAIKMKASDNDLSWQEGELTFDGSDFNDFVKKIERWYGVKIEVEGDPGDEWRVNGKFKNKPLAVVLESISFAENIDYSLQGTQVKLRFKER
ncbi:FecR family protein [Sunxiuqinia dokdonensis]|uniref:FecR protein domain-containing protein n=1 Tax=Sunxiuqinia dokdonensis TaxID=1409788 RepID=A0A0L8V8P6_9BACT|nr:FecR domain-containing protein [Sunxiuqinia dokdonensis]KOH44860.1 hypothetical protein NC99_22920 [Sunxiuqinia dokdonensis]